MAIKKINGFTLLEILIALFIFTIIAVVMTQALHNVLNTQSVTEKRINQLSELQTALLILSRDIEQIIDRPIMNGKGVQESAVDGSASSIHFTHAGFANPEGQATRSTLQRTSYYLENNKLIRETWPALDQAAKSVPAQRTLLKSVSDIRFEYLDDKNFFHQDWPPREQMKSLALPRAVRITLTLKNWGKISQTYLIAGQTIGTP